MQKGGRLNIRKRGEDPYFWKRILRKSVYPRWDRSSLDSPERKKDKEIFQKCHSQQGQY
jgi:hypothetical protein